jgi:hypothetical protein
MVFCTAVVGEARPDDGQTDHACKTDIVVAETLTE